MIKKEKNIPLLKYEVIHTLKGRIRVYCRAFKYLTNEKNEIEKQLEQVLAINKAKISVITKNILVTYDPNKLNEQNILDLLENILGNYSFLAYKNERIEKSKKNVVDKKIGEETTEEILKGLASTGALLAYNILKKTPSSSIFSYTSFGIISLAFPVIKNGILSLIKNKRPNADTLSASAIISSLLLKKEKSALSIILLEELSELITAYTMDKTRNTIKDMLSTGEDYVWLVNETEGVTRKVSIKQIKKGDLIVVHTGEKISVDGIITKGIANIDQSSITGEYMPTTKRLGDSVFAGTIVKQGTLTVRAEKVGDKTAVSRIIKLVEDATYNKAAIQSYADSISAHLIPVNFALFAFIYFLTKDIQKALSMLVIDYSCGVRLSTAAALSACINTAAKNGVLIKGSNYIEELSKADTLILDKTGTLTEGNPRVQTIEKFSKYTEEEILAFAGAAEERSTHPLAVSIINEVKGRGINIPDHSDAITVISRGMETIVAGDVIRVGSKKFMSENKVDVSRGLEVLKGVALRGEIPILVSKNKELIGILGVCDPLRENMKKAINRLRLQEIDDIILLTGDLQQQAQLVSDRIGMDRYESELMPEDKAKNILKLQSNGAKVVMIGDGINDAPALAYANVGMALGSKRTDIAMEAADVTITSDDPLMIPGIIDLSKTTMKIIKENFTLSIGVNTIAMLLGATGVISTLTGAIVHNLSTVLVVGNSLKILRYNIKK